MNNPNPVVYNPAEREASNVTDPFILEIFDLIRDIKDPEHPHTLEELNVVTEKSISVEYVTASGEVRKNAECAPISEAATSSGNPSQQAASSTSDSDTVWIRLEFTPTVPHCSLATLIGLCLRVKLERCLTQRYKLDIYVGEGTHSIEGDVNKQINDKERVAAAMENPDLRDMVEECIREIEY